MNFSTKNAIKVLDVSLRSWYPVSPLATNIFGFQSVRWRKPLWLPRAPSKMYVITHRKRLPPDETKELLRLYQNFKCYMRMTIEHCQKENQKRAESGRLSQQVLEQEEEEHRQLMEYNQRENERLAALRKERHEKEKEEMIQQIREKKNNALEMSKLEREKALQKLKETEELVETFIDPEKLDEAIEKALNNPADYNFAIDEDGRVYEGRLTNPHSVNIDSLPQLPVKDEGLTNLF